MQTPAQNEKILKQEKTIIQKGKTSHSDICGVKKYFEDACREI